MLRTYRRPSLDMWLRVGNPNHEVIYSLMNVRWTVKKINAKSNQIRSKIIPKSSKSRPKSIENPPKILPKLSQNLPRTLLQNWVCQKIEKNSIFSIFSQFLEGPGPPKMEPKSLKSAKKRINIDVQKKHVFQYRFFSIFHGFGLLKLLLNRGFFDTFSKTSI